MKNSVLIETLKTFSKEDMKEFGLFIESPFFNSNQSVIKLYEQIKKLYPDFEEKQLDKKKLFRNTFGKIEYNDGFMRMTGSRFLGLIKEFFVYRNLQSNHLMKETILLDELNHRELNNLMMKSIADLEKKINDQKAKDAGTYYSKYRLEYYKNDIKSRDTKMITYKDILDKDLMNEQKSLNTYFFISSLKFFQYFLNQKTFVVNAEGSPEFMDEVLEFLKTNTGYLNVPALKIYYYLVLMLINNDDNYFFELKEILYEDKGELSYIEKQNLIAVLRNYAQKRHQEGNEGFIEHSFDLLKFSVEKNILTLSPDGKFISEIRFFHVVRLGLNAKEFDWVEKFLKKYLNKIDPEKRQYVFAINSARLEFEKGNYQMALEKLGKTGSIQNVFYKGFVKQLTLMIYYELQWFVPAADLLDACRHFIRTDKLLPEMQKDQFNLFVNYFSRLLKLNDNTEKNSFEISKLISELESASQIWLLKKARELSS